MRGILNGRLNRVQDAFNIQKDIIVPKSQYPVSGFTEPAVSYFICVGFDVLAAVRFDNQFQFAADEIANVTVDRLLANEFDAADLSVSQVTP